MSQGRWFDRLLSPAEWLAALALGLLTTLVFTSVSLRYLLNAPIPDTYDFSRMLLGIAVFWGIAAACGADDHVRADVLWEFAGPRTRRWLDRIGRSLTIVFFALLCWKVLEKVADVQRTGESTSDTRTLLWPFLAIAWLATIVALAGVVVNLRRSLSHKPDRAGEHVL